MADNLRDDVLSKIFCELPIKYMLRCTSVCKSWYSLITTPKFISTHLTCTTSSSNYNSLLLLRHYCDHYNSEKETFSLQLDNETFDQYQQLDCPISPINEFLRIVGSCNGIICLSDDYGRYTYTIILWNPTIRRYVTLPIPRVTFTDYGPYYFVLGFGFDSRSQDYKIVRVSYIQDYQEYKVPPEVEVYSLSTGSWRGITTDVPPYYIAERTWSQVFMNGSVHWVGYTKAEKGYRSNSFILLFDMRAEVFDTMKLPENLVDGNAWNLTIAEFGGSLSVFQRHFKPPSYSIWVMKEYGKMESWTKQYTIVLQDDELGRILGCRNNNEVLMATNSRKLISYNPNSHQISDLRIRGTTNAFYVNSYVESIGLLDKANDAGGKKKNRKNSCDESELKENFEDSFSKEEEESNEEDENASVAVATTLR